MVNTDRGVHLDTISRIYIGIATTWTIVVLGVMAFLWHHRRLPHLQMRRLPLVFAAMGMLHVYGVLCYIAYVIGISFPCAIEFWDMNILLPLGIAVFQISNSQFLHIAEQQKRYTSTQSLDQLVRGSKKLSALDGRSGSLLQRTASRLENKDKITRMVIYVSIGMLLQVTLSLIIFLMSAKFHPGFGLLPNDFLGTDSQTRLNCARGWEWWLSILWQMFWAWIYAPYILWRSRKITDTHGWRIQTIACCISGLPASPLWLCSLYLSAFTTVNQRWIPPQWFVLSITLIEGFTLLIPCYHVYKHHNLRSETLAAISHWESRNNLGTTDIESTNVSSDLSFNACDNYEKGLLNTNSRSTKADKASSISRRSQMYTMLALEHALRWNADPLQKFAALKDFSGENISFLTHLATWHKSWPKTNTSTKHVEHDIRAQFSRAVSLYAAFVSAEHAEFPINVSSRTLKQLDAMFAHPADLLFSDTRSQSTYNSATPFIDTELGKGSNSNVGLSLELSAALSKGQASLNVDELQHHGDIPPLFGPNVFEDAENEIKYLVLTNTWPKFVNAGLVEQIRDEHGRTLNQRLSLWIDRRTGRS